MPNYDLLCGLLQTMLDREMAAKSVESSLNSSGGGPSTSSHQMEAEQYIPIVDWIMLKDCEVEEEGWTEELNAAPAVSEEDNGTWGEDEAPANSEWAVEDIPTYFMTSEESDGEDSSVEANEERTSEEVPTEVENQFEVIKPVHDEAGAQDNKALGSEVEQAHAAADLTKGSIENLDDVEELASNIDEPVLAASLKKTTDAIGEELFDNVRKTEAGSDDQAVDEIENRLEERKPVLDKADAEDNKAQELEVVHPPADLFKGSNEILDDVGEPASKLDEPMLATSLKKTVDAIGSYTDRPENTKAVNGDLLTVTEVEGLTPMLADDYPKIADSFVVQAHDAVNDLCRDSKKLSVRKVKPESTLEGKPEGPASAVPPVKIGDSAVTLTEGEEVVASESRIPTPKSPESTAPSQAHRSKWWIRLKLWKRCIKSSSDEKCQKAAEISEAEVASAKSKKVQTKPLPSNAKPASKSLKLRFKDFWGKWVRRSPGSQKAGKNKCLQ
ncbi:hypothetical protein HDU96_003148 [Phlyctochytrium bullatum]|nr:hypothetical protein HDU96_003148 [Phlyctochytrium bullatum]